MIDVHVLRPALEDWYVGEHINSLDYAEKLWQWSDLTWTEFFEAFQEEIVILRAYMYYLRDGVNDIEGYKEFRHGLVNVINKNVRLLNKYNQHWDETREGDHLRVRRQEEPWQW